MSNEETKSNDEFIDKMLKVCSGEHNRKARAELRRYWSPTTRHYAFPVLGRLGVLYRSDQGLRADSLVTLLYAINPEHRLGGLSFGKAALKLAGGSSKSDSFESFERHFRRLLSCEGGDLEDLGQQLHRILKRMERDNIALDYNQLLWDLRNWKNKADDVKTNWARAFWNAPSEVELSVTSFDS